jgi:hypothetical protein
MKTNLITILALSVTFLAGTVSAQTVSATATPVPAQPAATAPVAPAPSQTVYTRRLPTAAELSAAAAAQGLTVERIEQSATVVTAVYRNANGQYTSVAYLPLPGTAPAAPAQAAPPSTVYVETAPRVVYYEDYPPYYVYPRYWYPPVSVGIGFGFRGGFHHR